MSAKYALIIGNTEYTDPGLAQLTAPGKDAEDFSRILRAPEICGFDEVRLLLNEPEYMVRGAIDEFFDQKRPDDLLVFYFSGHGVRDELGSLYLAVKNTIRTRLRSTAIKSDYIREAMDHSRSRRQVLVLDCCNSGAFEQGTKAATGVSIGTATAFEAGYGRVILTASDSTQFAWEGNRVIGETSNSLFTHFLVEGLSGEADLNGDGRITVDELYDYAYEKVKLATPKQTPSKFSSKQQGEIVLREGMRMEDIKPAELPAYLVYAIENPDSDVRLGAVQSLRRLLSGKNLGLARAAKEALKRIALEDDSRRVSQAAKEVLGSIPAEEQKTDEDQALQGESEGNVRARAEETQLAQERVDAEREARRLALQREKEEQIVPAKEQREPQKEQRAEPEQKHLQAAPLTGKELARPRMTVPQRALYGIIIAGLILAFGLLGRYAMQRNAEPETGLAPTETEQGPIATATIERTPGATSLVVVQSPPATTAIVETPSQEPSPVSTAAMETFVSIAASKAYLYKGPDQAFGLAVQIAYARGEKLTLLARNPSGLWFLCQAADGNQGWLYRDWLEVDFEPLVIPTASFIPSLPPTQRPGGGGGGAKPTNTCVFC